MCDVLRSLCYAYPYHVYIAWDNYSKCISIRIALCVIMDRPFLPRAALSAAQEELLCIHKLPGARNADYRLAFRHHYTSVPDTPPPGSLPFSARLIVRRRLQVPLQGILRRKLRPAPTDVRDPTDHALLHAYDHVEVCVLRAGIINGEAAAYPLCAIVD